MAKVILPPSLFGLCKSCGTNRILRNLSEVEKDRVVADCEVCGSINSMTKAYITDNATVKRCEGCGGWVHVSTMCVTCEIVRRKNVSYTSTY